MLEQAAEGLARQLAQQPTDSNLRAILLESYLYLGDCHLKASQPDKATQAYRNCDQILEKALEQDPKNATLWAELVASYRTLGEHYLKAGQIEKATLAYSQAEKLANRDASGRPPTSQQLRFLCWLSDTYLEANQSDAALEKARQAAALLAKYRSAAATVNAEERYQLDCYLFHIAHRIRRAGQPLEALRLAEEGKQVFQELLQQTPGDHRYALGLFESWEQIGKVYAELDQPDEAAKAWLQGVAVLRKVVEQAPANNEYRRGLGNRYRNLSRHFRGERRLAEAESWLQELEKFCPEDAERLREVSQEYAELATAVGQEREELSPEEQAQQQHYREQSARVAQAATALSPKGRGTAEQAK
jgi:tetratricopeptide (TPR) repeat protein